MRQQILAGLNKSSVSVITRYLLVFIWKSSPEVFPASFKTSFHSLFQWLLIGLQMKTCFPSPYSQLCSHFFHQKQLFCLWSFTCISSPLELFLNLSYKMTCEEIEDSFLKTFFSRSFEEYTLNNRNVVEFEDTMKREVWSQIYSQRLWVSHSS